MSDFVDVDTISRDRRRTRLRALLSLFLLFALTAVVIGVIVGMGVLIKVFVAKMLGHSVGRTWMYVVGSLVANSLLLYAIDRKG